MSVNLSKDPAERPQTPTASPTPAPIHHHHHHPVQVACLHHPSDWAAIIGGGLVVVLLFGMLSFVLGQANGSNTVLPDSSYSAQDGNIAEAFDVYSGVDSTVPNEFTPNQTDFRCARGFDSVTVSFYPDRRYNGTTIALESEEYSSPLLNDSISSLQDQMRLTITFSGDLVDFVPVSMIIEVSDGYYADGSTDSDSFVLAQQQDVVLNMSGFDGSPITLWTSDYVGPEHFLGKATFCVLPTT